MSYQSFIQSLPGLITHLPLKANTTDLKGNTWSGNGLEHSQSFILDTDQGTSSARLSSSDSLFSTNVPADRSGGFTVSFLFSTDGVIPPFSDALFSQASSTNNDSFFLVFTSASGGLRLLFRDDNGETMLDVNFGQPNMWNNLPHQLIYTEDDNRNYRLILDGVEIKTGQYIAGTQTLNRTGLGCLYRSSATNQFSAYMAQLFMLGREITQPEIDRAVQEWWTHGGKMTDADNLYCPADRMISTQRHAFLVQTDEPCAFLGGLIQQIGTSQTLSVDVYDTAEGNDASASIPTDNSEIYGRINSIDNYSAGVNVRQVFPAGRYWVAINSTQPVEGLFCLRSEVNSLVIPDVKDGYSNPRCAKVGNNHVHYVASLGRDDRGIKLVAEDGSAVTYKLDDGYTLNDINHAGGFVLPLTNGGLLVGHCGHNDDGIRCDYFADADVLSETPTTSYTVNASGGVSYPNAIELHDGTVFIYFRGNLTGGTTPHSGCTVRFDPTDGSGEQGDVFVDTSAGDWRMYAASVTHGIGSDGDEYVGFVFNPRSWNSGYPEQICAAAYSVTNNQWFSPKGTQLGGTDYGTDGTGNGRTDVATLLTDVSADGCRLLETPSGFNTVLCGDTQSCMINLGTMPAVLSGYIIYTLANQETSGGFDYSASLRHLSFNGETLTDHGQLDLSPGQPITAFNSVAMKMVGPTLKACVALQTRRQRVNVTQEPVSPYYIGWGGGDTLIGISVANPFSSSPIVTEDWVTKLETSAGQTRPVHSSYDWCIPLTRPNSPHPVIAPSTQQIVDEETGRISQSGISKPGVGLDPEELSTAIDAAVNAIRGDGNDDLKSISDAIASQSSGVTAEVDTAGVVSGVLNGLSAITLSFDSFDVTDGEILEVDQGDDYTGSTRQKQIDIESADDLSAYHLIIAARPQTSGGSPFALRMAIEGSVGSQYAIFNPSSEVTEQWATGDYELRYKIEIAENKFKTFKRGRLVVRPFDTPTPIIDLTT